MGAISIVLGYRLFSKGIGSLSKKENDTSINARFGKFRFILNDAAPGTCFALFGCAIIVFMIYSGGPEMTLNQIKKTSPDVSLDKDNNIEEFSLKLRSKDESPIGNAFYAGKLYERSEPNKAIKAYQKALNLMADPLNYLAWHYQKQGKIDQALAMAGLVIELYPDNASYLDTMATILRKKGKHSEARRYLEKAAKLNPKYQEKLNKSDE